MPGNLVAGKRWAKSRPWRGSAAQFYWVKANASNAIPPICTA